MSPKNPQEAQEAVGSDGFDRMPPRGCAQSSGMDLQPLAAATQRLRGQVNAGKLPGFMSCVVKDGQLIHFDSAGFADVASQAAMRPDVLFRLYSQTKPVLVVGILKLKEAGQLSLDDPVSKYIPSFSKLVVGEKRRALARHVLLRDLLAHTSGIGFGPGFGYEPENDYERTYVDLVGRVDRGEVTSLAQWCELLAQLPLRFQPGKDWGYGYSSDVLGRIAEVVSGQPLDVFLESEVIKPLGMVDTAFAVPTAKAKRLSALYRREPWDGSGKNVEFIPVDEGGSSSSAFLEGKSSAVLQGGGCVCSVAGGLVSTLADWARFGQMLLNEGSLDQTRIITPESVRLLVRDWLNDFSTEKRRRPLWVWGVPGIGFSPLGQVGVEHADAGRRLTDNHLHTVHWGGAGGSGYLISWPHKLLVLTYSGCALDTETQKTMWRAAFVAIRRKRSTVTTPARLSLPAATGVETTPGAKRPASASPATPRSAKKPSSAERAAARASPR